MSSFRPSFEDKKLSKLFQNFKARNYPETLTEDEQEDWFEIVQSRVQSGENVIFLSNISKRVSAG